MLPAPRWKYPNADDCMLQNPVSQIYKQLQALPPVKSFIAHTAVILSADVQQSDLLNSACFGRPFLAGSQASLSCDHSTKQGSPWQEDNAKDERGEMLLFELGLEEAFFLCYELRCLQIYCKAQQDHVCLNDEALWQLMLKRKNGFLYYYKAYSHLRKKNWILRTGLQYGAHFVAYRHHPAQVHAEYAVIVVPEPEKQIQVSSWSHMQGMIRLCGSVAKTLLLLHVTPSKNDDTDPRSLDLFSVHEVEVKRWLPKKHREDNGTSNSKFENERI